MICKIFSFRDIAKSVYGLTCIASLINKLLAKDFIVKPAEYIIPGE